MRFLELPGRNSAFNLALEECLLTSLPENSEGLFLVWQNSPSIIIGRHQVAAEVVNQAKAMAANIPVIRRISGGGAVYHDAGNLNFTFIDNTGSAKRIDFKRYLITVCAALADLDISAEISGRNDLEVNGMKISGSSQVIRSGTVLHHGTILFNADLKAMHDFLQVRENKFRTKGIPSHKARVANLLELSKNPFSLADLKAALIARCSHGRAALSPETLDAAARLARRKYGTRAWNYGKSPKFEFEKRRRFAWGEVAIHLQIVSGLIAHCRISGDFFSNDDIEALAAKFANLPFRRESIAQALADCEWERWFVGSNAEAMRQFFQEDIFS